jgi:NitT/TauT family transport system permease protein
VGKPLKASSNHLGGLKSVAVQAIVVIAFLLGWQLTRSLNLISKLFLAAPSDLLSGAWLSGLPGAEGYFEVTLVEVVGAFVIAAVAGVGIGLALGQSNYLQRVLDPFIVWGYSIPKIAIFPIFILFFGLGQSSVIAYASMSAFFVILLNTLTGVQGIDQELVRVGRSLGFGPFQRYTKIALPSMVPILFSGLRQGLIQAVLGCLVAELVMASVGVGSLIDNLSYEFRTPELYGIIAIVSLLMIAVNMALLRVESGLSFWRQ